MVKTVDYTYHDPKVTSSAISEIWYSSTTRELFVKFRDSQQVAGYSDVSPVAADKLADAASVGQYYAKYIKPNYKGINTKDVVFRAAPGLAKKTTTPSNIQGPIFPTKNVYTTIQVSPKKKFQVTGYVLRPQSTTDTIEADTFEEAIALFRKKYVNKEPELKEVRAIG